MTSNQAVNLILVNAKNLATISPFDLVAVLQQFGLFDQFHSVVSTKTLLDYVQNLNNLYPEETIVSLAEQVAQTIVTFLNDKNIKSQEDLFFAKTYAPLVKSALEYQAEILNLKNSLVEAKANIKNSLNSQFYTELYTKEFETISAKITSLTSQLKAIQAQIPAKSLPTSPNSQDKANWDMFQLTKKLEALAKSIINLQNSNGDLYNILLLKFQFNSILNQLTPPWNSKFILYSY